MATVIVSWSTKKQDFPAGTVAAGFRVTLDSPGASPVDVPSAAPVSFADVPAGDWIATVTAIDTSGATLGDPATASFNIPEVPASLDVPDVVSVTVV